MNCVLEGCSFVEEEVFERLGKVAEQMEAVSALYGLGRSGSGTLCIGAATVTANDLHSWMFNQPLG